jgi:hypothetical protein
MTRRRIAMPNLKEIFRLKQEGFSNRVIHRSTGVARSTISEHVDCAQQAGLTVAQALLLPETELEQLLFPPETLPLDTIDPFRTGNKSIRNCTARASPGSSCGSNTASSIPTVSATRSTAPGMTAGEDGTREAGSPTCQRGNQGNIGAQSRMRMGIFLSPATSETSMESIWRRDASRSSPRDERAAVTGNVRVQGMSYSVSQVVAVSVPDPP